jgi:hypothetical protein
VVVVEVVVVVGGGATGAETHAHVFTKCATIEVHTSCQHSQTEDSMILPVLWTHNLARD